MKNLSIIFIVFLCISVVYLFYENKKINNKYLTSIENIKAYDLQLSKEKSNNRVLNLTIKQLNYFSDSILTKIKEVKKELNIKDKHLKQAQYELSHASRKDTIVLKDTIFKSPSFKLDTIIGDKWFKNRLQLAYPNHITSSISFSSEKFCFVQLKKETVNPPKKFFLTRWFQKKHWVTIVTIKENNPYVEIKDSRFIQIINN